MDVELKTEKVSNGYRSSLSINGYEVAKSFTGGVFFSDSDDDLEQGKESALELLDSLYTAVYEATENGHVEVI